MKARIAIVVISLVGTLSAVTSPAHASFHLIKIVEVFAGMASAPNAQFVELQMYSSGQTNLTGHSVVLETTASGSPVTSTFTFTSNLTNGADQASVLIATQEAETAFGFTPDLRMDPVLNATNGKACFDPEPNEIDCVAWGSHPGSTATGPPFSPTGGIPSGSSIQRKTSGGSKPNELDAQDDTDDSAADFQTSGPTPQPNSLGGGGTGDTLEPSSKITAPKHQTAITRSESTNFQGKGSDQGGSDVAKVDIALRQKTKGGCKWWNGNKFTPGSCKAKVFELATGTKKWSYDLPKQLKPTGKKVKNYTLYSRATDGAGNVEAEYVPKANLVKFEVYKTPIVCGPKPC